MKLTPAKLRLLKVIETLNSIGKRANKANIKGPERLYASLREDGLITSSAPFAAMYHTCHITEAGRKALEEAE